MTFSRTDERWSGEVEEGKFNMWKEFQDQNMTVVTCEVWTRSKKWNSIPQMKMVPWCYWRNDVTEEMMLSSEAPEKIPIYI